MTLMKSFGIVLLVILVNGHFNPLPAVDEQRKAYDKMVEEATREADDYVEEKQKKQLQAAEEQKNQSDPALDARVQAERERIEAEMNTIRERGLGPNFTEGMRENQLQELESKLNQLTSDPQAYFEE